MWCHISFSVIVVNVNDIDYMYLHCYRILAIHQYVTIVMIAVPKITTTPPTVAVKTETPMTTVQQASLKVPGEVFKSCLSVVRSGKSAGTGLYLLDPGNTGKPVQALCDMSTDGGKP